MRMPVSRGSNSSCRIVRQSDCDMQREVGESDGSEAGMNTFTGKTGAVLRFDDLGSGTPILALHGAYSAHQEIRAVFEPILAPLDAYRRIYPDLPGMGDTPPHKVIQNARDVVELLNELIEAEIGDAPFLLAGHSYGGHLARGLSARCGGRIAGLALICPWMPATMNREEHLALTTGGVPTDWLEPELVDEYIGYFVVHSPATAERFREAVAPVFGIRWRRRRADHDRLGAPP
jgi:pimeloyl-ACP methyl ester carboxylesterase